jgi:hypothetical protein
VQLYRQALAYQTRGKVGSGTCIKGDDNFDRRYGPFLRVNVCANVAASRIRCRNIFMADSREVEYWLDTAIPFLEIILGGAYH